MIGARKLSKNLLHPSSKKRGRTLIGTQSSLMKNPENKKQKNKVIQETDSGSSPVNPLPTPKMSLLPSNFKRDTCYVRQRYYGIPLLG